MELLGSFSAIVTTLVCVLGYIPITGAMVVAVFSPVWLVIASAMRSLRSTGGDKPPSYLTIKTSIIFPVIIPPASKTSL